MKKVKPPLKKVKPGGLRKVKPDTQSAWGSPQEKYQRGCMLLLFHKSLYEHRGEPCLTDADYDRLERFVEKLEKAKGVKTHPRAPTGKNVTPALEDMPQTIRTWLEIYDETGHPPALPAEFV